MKMRHWLILGLSLGSLRLAHATPMEQKWKELMWGQALRQSDNITADWDPSQRDCAGFIRFLYRTSISGKAKMWMSAKGELTDYVGAGDLIRHNFTLVTRDLSDFSQVRTGDVLVYFRPEYPNESAWHLMLVLEPHPMTAQKPLTIYHNGSRGSDAIIRKVWLEMLMSPGWGIWKPQDTNLYFQGLYRWKGWDSAEFRKKVLGGAK